MSTEKKVILFGAGTFGRYAFNFFGPNKVFCFADNKKAGETFLGKNVISCGELKRLHSDFDVVLTVSDQFLDTLEEQCKTEEIPYKIFPDLVTYEGFQSNPQIADFKNKHKGKRCFLIGNGPSLNHDDLTTLHRHQEITFACNGISKIFNQTPWRPNYYMAADQTFLAVDKSWISIEAEYKFFPAIDEVFYADEAAIQHLYEQNGGQNIYFNIIGISGSSQPAGFSSDVSKATYLGGTIMYGMIQFAVYMGFAEIHLLGVDGTNTTPNDLKEYFAKKRHFYAEDKNVVRKQATYTKSPCSFAKRRCNKVYAKAEKYAREHEVRICNATRGGELEIFERVCFDALFEKH